LRVDLNKQVNGLSIKTQSYALPIRLGIGVGCVHDDSLFDVGVEVDDCILGEGVVVLVVLEEEEGERYMD
jgi:hypothetical protein